MANDPPAVLRALEGLREFSGRTVAIVGPPLSGKTATLDRLGEASERVFARIVRLKGSYADRLVPYAGLAGLRGGPGAGNVEGDGLPAGGVAGLEVVAPMAPVAVNPEALPRSHRRRVERARGSFLPDPRPRGAEAIDLPSYWEELVLEFQGPSAHPVVVLVDDAAFLDPESRTFLLGLGARAGWRPLLLVLALDSTVGETSLWEEALRGRPATDWIRQPESAPDLRETRRYRTLSDALPERTRRFLGYLALLGGEAPDHLLTRIARQGRGLLLDTLRPAQEKGLVRFREGRFTMPDRAAASILADLIPEAQRSEMHREIAEALEALSPEPTLARRIEVAHHYLAGRPGATAMSHLVQAAEVCLNQLSFDTASDLLQEAFGCLVEVPPADRRVLEPEVRLALARALFYSGRPAEAEAQFREGVERALEAGTPSGDLSTAIEPLVLAMRAVGPRDSLLETLTEVAFRCGEHGREEAVVLLETLRTELLVERQEYARAEESALRAARAARRRPERHLQAMGLLAMGIARLRGDPEDVFPAERFLRSAHHLLANARRWEFDYLVAELEVRLLEARGAVDQARQLREGSLTVLASEKLPSIELAHHLGLAGFDLDQGNVSAAATSLDRAGHLAETMHLLPPSPLRLEYGVLEGRRRALLHEFDAAREIWSAIVDLPADATLPRERAEAMVRLALLFHAQGRADDARELGVFPPTAGELAVVPETWSRWLAGTLEPLVRPEVAGGRLPPVATAPPA